MVVAIMLAAPDFIDRLERPSTCMPGCIDLRGVAFIVLLLLFTPVLAVTAAALLLRRGRIWLSWLALAVNVIVAGFIAFSGVLPLITGGTSCSDMCDSFDYGHVPLLVQDIQVVLLTVPPLASLLVIVLFLSSTLIKPSRPRSPAPGA